MDYSRNEISALVKSAAKGVGYSWGVAEDIAFSTLWLACRDENALERLYKHLEAQSKDFDKTACPLLQGIKLSDEAHHFESERVFLNQNQPLLFIAFVAGLAQKIECTLAVSFDDCSIFVSKNGFEKKELPPYAEKVIVRVSESDYVKTDISHRITANALTIEALKELALNSYAPSTDASRLYGAGGADDGND